MSKSSAALKQDVPDNEMSTALGALTHVALGNLRYGHDKDAGEQINARVTNRDEGLDGLAALVKAYGIVIPLIVVNRGTLAAPNLFVLNGNRRMKVLRDILKVSPETNVPVRCIDAPDGKALEISLVTGISELRLHPVDEFEGFSKVVSNLVEHGTTYADAVARVALDFGREQIEVERALALGRLSPKIREAWRKNDINRASAEAFTLAYDFAAGDVKAGHKAQDALFDKLDKANGLNAWSIKNALRRENTDLRAAAYVNYVGADEFAKAGGKMTRDLFGSEHIIFTPLIAKELADKKLEAVCAELISKQGWLWAKPETQMKKEAALWRTQNVEGKPTPAEKKRLKEINDILDGEVDVEISDEEETKLIRERDATNDAIDQRAYTDAIKKKSGVIASVTSAGKLALRMGVLEPNNNAAAMKGKSAGGAGLGLSEGSRADASDTPATKKAAVSVALAQRLRIMKDTATQKALVADVKTPRLPALLASICATLISTQGYNSTPDVLQKKLDMIRDMVTPKIMNDALRAEFDAEDYFANISSDHRIKQMVEMGLKPDKKAKKGELIKLAIKTAASAKWLPKELRTSHYDGPGSKGTKKR